MIDGLRVVPIREGIMAESKNVFIRESLNKSL